MKKIILLLFILSSFIFSPSNAGVGVSYYGSSLGETASAAGPCDNLGNADMYWDGDHTTSTVTGCVSGDVITGSLTGATISTDQNHTAGGQYALDPTSGNDYLNFPVTLEDIFVSSAGAASFWVYPTATTGYDGIFEATGLDGTDEIWVTINPDNTISYRHKGQGNQVDVTSSDTVSDAAWNQVEIRWSVAEDKIGIKINSGSWLDDSDGTAVTVFGTEPSNVTLGEHYGDGWTETVYIDDLHVWKTYDQS